MTTEVIQAYAHASELDRHVHEAAQLLGMTTYRWVAEFAYHLMLMRGDQ